MNAQFDANGRAQYDAIVVGAGPVGLFGALLLATKGHRVLVLEAGDELGTLSKASTFHPGTLELLDEVRVVDELLSLGVIVDEVQWRKLDGEVFARVPFSVLESVTKFPFRLHAEQTLLTPILLRELESLDNAQVRFGASCVGVTQSDAGVIASVRGASGEYEVSGSFLLACDGAHSEVRKYVGVEFPGASYESRALRVITREDLRERLPGLSGIAYVRDEAQSCSLLHMRDHWRFIFRVAGKDSDAEVLEPAAVRALVDAVAPGTSIDFAEVYGNRAHVASQYTVGRVAFAGDSAHVTSTAGGMNMNCGLHDVYEMARAVDAVMGGAELSVFEDAGAKRRAVVREAIIPRIEARASGADGAADALAKAIASFEALAGDPERAFTFLYEASMLDTSPKRHGE